MQKKKTNFVDPTTSLVNSCYHNKVLKPPLHAAFSFAGCQSLKIDEVLI